MPRTTFSQQEREIFAQPVLVHVATLMADGSPTVSPMWVELDGDTIVLNTEEGRTKPRNIRHDDRIALSVVDPAEIFHAITVRGTIVDITYEGADAGIDRLSRKYIGRDYPWRVPGRRRVQFKVQPTSIYGFDRDPIPTEQ